MEKMTDSRAVEVLAAHNEWRRHDGDPFGPDAPEMGDPAEIGRAIDHAVSRLRSQPPAEAQAQGGGESAAWKALGAVESELGPLVGMVHDPDNPIHRALEAAMAALNQRDTAPPSAPVGVEGHYHPCTSILIEGLKRLEGGSDVLEEWDRARVKVDTALAQQPAAVDGAMVERALAAYLRRQEDGESLYGCVTAALTAALAAQQGGAK